MKYHIKKFRSTDFNENIENFIKTPQISYFVSLFLNKETISNKAVHNSFLQLSDFIHKILHAEKPLYNISIPNN